MSFIGTSLALYLPQFIGKLLDEHFLKLAINDPSILVVSAAFFIIVYSLQAFSSYIIGICGSRSLNKLQKHIYSSLLRTSVKELDKYKAGDLSSRLTNDMSVVLNFITVVFPNLILNLIVIIGSVYFLLKINLSLALMSLSLFPILLFVIIPINNKLEDYYADYQGGLGEISSRISHKFTHIRLMKAFNGEENEQKVMSNSFDRLTKNFNKIVGWSSFQNTLVNGLMMSFIILLLVVAGLEVSKGSMTMSTLMTFVLYMTQLIDPITDVSESMAELTEFKSVSNRLIEILELSKEENKTVGQNFLTSNIVMKNVDFAYNQDNVLENLSVTVEPGQHIAIVGPSGAGKTTIFSLLMKFYQNYSGEILIGNHNYLRSRFEI
jgi:ATP-binding cassette subfamily B protein AbcA/BmrA